MRAGVIFDLDGVLIDSEDLQFEAYARVLARLGVTIDRAEYGREWIAAGRGPEYAVKTYALPLSADELRARKAPVYRELLQKGARLMPGVPEALRRLAKEYPLAVATNSKAAEVEFVLSYFDLLSLFTAVIPRERYARAKPEPDAFLAAAAALGLPPVRCVVVEDSHRGVVAAHRAGAKCVAIPHSFTRDQDFRLASRVIGELNQLTPDLVEELLAG